MSEEIKKLQLEMMEKYFNEYKKLYSGEITYEQYKINRVDNVSLWYAKEMVKLGVATSVFTKRWMQKFADDTLAIERNAVMVKNGITAEEGQALCKVAIEQGIKFFENFHNDFCPRLVDKKIIHEDYKDSLEAEKIIVRKLMEDGEWLKWD